MLTTAACADVGRETVLMLVSHGCLIPSRDAPAISVGVLNTGRLPLTNVTLTTTSFDSLAETVLLPVLAPATEVRLGLTAGRGRDGLAGTVLEARLHESTQHTTLTIVCDLVQRSFDMELTDDATQQTDAPVCGIVCIVNACALSAVVCIGVGLTIRDATRLGHSNNPSSSAIGRWHSRGVFARPSKIPPEWDRLTDAVYFGEDPVQHTAAIRHVKGVRTLLARPSLQTAT
jgi:hypothetical protein